MQYGGPGDRKISIFHFRIPSRFQYLAFSLKNYSSFFTRSYLPLNTPRILKRVVPISNINELKAVPRPQPSSPTSHFCTTSTSNFSKLQTSGSFLVEGIPLRLRRLPLPIRQTSAARYYQIVFRPILTSNRFHGFFRHYNARQQFLDLQRSQGQFHHLFSSTLGSWRKPPHRDDRLTCSICPSI